MSTAAWWINIVGGPPPTPARFEPSNLFARVDDIISWNNQSGASRALVRQDDKGNWVPVEVPPIPSGEQSDAWSVPDPAPSTTITYGCASKNGAVTEIGTITISK
jgi:hypothetical protein